MTDILLFDNIDEPGLNTLEVYERRGGYQALRKALVMPPQELVAQIRAGAEPLPAKQLSARPSADPKVAGGDA